MSIDLLLTTVLNSGKNTDTQFSHDKRISLVQKPVLPPGVVITRIRRLLLIPGEREPGLREDIAALIDV